MKPWMRTRFINTLRNMRGPPCALEVVVAGDEPADSDAGAHVHPLQHRVEDGAAGVLEVHVDAVGAVTVEGLSQILGAPVDGRVETELLDQPAALLVGTGDAHDPTASQLAELGGDGAHRQEARPTRESPHALRFAHSRAGVPRTS